MKNQVIKTVELQIWVYRMIVLYILRSTNILLVMMSRKAMITSALLVVGYFVVYYYTDKEHQRNKVMNMVLYEILNEEIRESENLMSITKYLSKKKSSWMDYNTLMTDELVMILDMQEKPMFRNTGFIADLFDKYDIDSSFLSEDLSKPLPKYQLYRAVNDQLKKHIEHLDESEKSMSNLKLRLLDKNDTYAVNEIHKLDFQFFEKGNFDNQVKYFYEINGVKKRIAKLPLILDSIPKDIKFSQSLKCNITGEIRTLHSKLTP